MREIIPCLGRASDSCGRPVCEFKMDGDLKAAAVVQVRGANEREEIMVAE